MAVIASIAVMPVYSGSFTGCRETTLGACSSSGRSASAVIVPLSSIGRPSASTTRPRNPSPTGTERIRPVCLTGSPSSIVAASPKMMQPISASSRLNATPSSPPGNSSSSLAIVRGRPATRAMPSPVSMTRPTSSRSTDGVQLSTFLRSASAMTLGSIRLDAISSSAPECVLGVFEAARYGAVEDEVVDASDHAADHGWIHDDLRLDRAAGGLGERLLQTLALGVGERNRGADLGHG